MLLTLFPAPFQAGHAHLDVQHRRFVEGVEVANNERRVLSHFENGAFDNLLSVAHFQNDNG